MILLLSIVGALAVLSFLAFLGFGLARGWDDPAARGLLRLAGGLGIVCAVIGVLLPVLGA
ncbi:MULTISPECIES: hypothetical protein [Brachybacterium]|uniref:hypothetical protein n=1 Tax=Brachybacterium TaxID=43668 RepID=UPI0007A4837B|nr:MULTISPECIES: hypothetical protein [Brachybacterium]